MKLKLFYVVAVALALASYFYAWYNGLSVPAWQAAIWCAYVFFNEFNEYLDMKTKSIWS